MKKVILFSLILFLLTGCNLYNPSGIYKTPEQMESYCQKEENRGKSSCQEYEMGKNLNTNIPID